jgi:hypothetical protein
MSGLPVLLGAPDLPQEPELVTRLTGPGAAVVVARRCVDAVDLVGAAASSSARVAIVSAGLPRLARDAIARLAAAQVRVIGIALEGDEVSARKLSALGIAVITIPVDDIDRAVAVIVQASDDAHPSRWEYSGVGAPVWAGGSAEPPLSGPPSTDPLAPGHLIAVWGPTGAP